MYDKKGFDALVSDLQNSSYEKASELIAIALKNEYSRLNDWDKYAYVIDAALDFSLWKNNEKKFNYFDSAASMIAKASKDKAMLQRALRWADYASTNEDRVQYKSGYLATKANLLELVGNAEAAKATKSASKEADLKAEKEGTKIISIPAFKMGGMKPAKGKKNNGFSLLIYGESASYLLIEINYKPIAYDLGLAESKHKLAIKLSFLGWLKKRLNEKFTCCIFSINSFLVPGTR